MSNCPACRAEPLVELDAAPGARVELCRACKGMLLDCDTLDRLAGGGCEAVSAPCPAEHDVGPCLRCNTASWECRALLGAAQPAFYVCGVCRMVWLLARQLEPLGARARAERLRERAATREPPPGLAVPTPVPVPVLDTNAAPPEPFDRVSFESGVANWVAAPSALILALAFCATTTGRFFGSLVGMPFHELGHALTSWLSSRFAVPLPFFTVWHDRQSVLFGLLVAAIIAAFGVRSWLEERRFGMSLAATLLLLQLGLSWLVPPRLTLMLQILGGALGEIVLGALLLIAFHFPLPDRLRWDFWRWPALVPGSICLGNALLLWSRAARDVRQMPWGAAIGDESDGDMNRLVNGFGWRARELASFYLSIALASIVALALAQVWAFHRYRRALPPRAGVTSSVPLAVQEHSHANPPHPTDE